MSAYKPDKDIPSTFAFGPPFNASDTFRASANSTGSVGSLTSTDGTVTDGTPLSNRLEKSGLNTPTATRTAPIANTTFLFIVSSTNCWGKILESIIK